MTTISNTTTVLAIVPEVTEGVPVAPTSATQYTPIQDDLAMKPNFDVNPNKELVGSIAQRQSILGAAKPTMSKSQYLKSSGVEGQAPDWSPILEAAFGTKTVVSGTEEVTAASSTVSTIKATSGHGSNFAKGRLLLIKDGTNGYSLRFVDSVSTDDLSLSFNLANAPGTGVALGKPVYYTVAQSGHKSHAFWQYLGNGGAIQMMSGGRITSLGMQITAGGLINCSVAGEGSDFYFNPIETTSSLRYIDFEDDDGTFAAAVTAQMYHTPKELCDSLATAMNASGTTQTYTVTYSNTTGQVTIKGTGTLLSLLFATGTNTANTIATALGFTATDKTGTAATTGYTGPALTFGAPQTPSYDDMQPFAAKNNEIMIGDATDYTVFEASEIGFTLTDTRTVKPSICAVSGIGGSLITARSAKVTFKAFLDKYDVSKYDRYRENTSTRFQYSFGNKVGTNWKAGQCGGLYLPTTTITSFEVSNTNGVSVVSGELTTYVPADASGEVVLALA